MRACTVQSQESAGAAAPPTLLTYGHESTNQLDLEYHRRSLARQARIERHNREAASQGRQAVTSCLKLDAQGEKERPGYVRPLL